jgi:vacuolar protein sorting-associated protein 35
MATKFANSPDLHSQQAQTNVLRLLQSPIKAYHSIFTALALPHYIPLLQSQPYPTRRAIAGEVARLLLKNQIPIDTRSNLDAALEVMRVIIKEGVQQQSGYSGPIARKAAETEETIEEQGWLARITHLIQSPVNDTQFEVSVDGKSIQEPILMIIIAS